MNISEQDRKNMPLETQISILENSLNLEMQINKKQAQMSGKLLEREARTIVMMEQTDQHLKAQIARAENLERENTVLQNTLASMNAFSADRLDVDDTAAEIKNLQDVNAAQAKHISELQAHIRSMPDGLAAIDEMEEDAAEAQQTPRRDIDPLIKIFGGQDTSHPKGWVGMPAFNALTEPASAEDGGKNQ